MRNKGDNMKSLTNQNGTSVVGVLVAIGLTVLLADMTMRLSAQNSRVSATSRIDAEILAHAEQLKTVLAATGDLTVDGLVAQNGFEVSRIDKLPVQLNGVKMIQFNAVYKRSKVALGSEYVVRQIGTVLAPVEAVEVPEVLELNKEDEEQIKLVAEQIVKEHKYLRNKKSGCK